MRVFVLLAALVSGCLGYSKRRPLSLAKFLRSPYARSQNAQGHLRDNLPVYSFETYIVNQTTDHFSFGPVTPPTFQQRILINATYWKGPKYPILFYTGNEGPIESFAQNTGFMWDIAPHLGAMVVFAEHRYYGESTPFPGENLFADPVNATKLAYLSTEQALRDFVANIDWLKDKYEVSPKAAVIAIGGSYGGMLSAYLRLKYPWAVTGALAASAPMMQFPGLMPDGDISAFFRIITEDYKAFPGCAESIRLSWDVIDRLEGQSLGEFKRVFNLCDDLTSYDQVDVLKEWLQSAYIYMAMTDYQYDTNFLRPLPGEPVAAACKAFSPAAQIPQDPYVLLRQVTNAISVFYNYTGSCNCQCFKLFDESEIDVGEDGWDYQSCTEYMLPMASNGKTDMFYPQAWDQDAFIAGCQERYNVTPKVNWAAHEMGGAHFELSSNIIFSNGGRDPWSGGGFKKDLNPSVVALFVPEGAHHLDLRANNPLDPISVRRVRQREVAILRTWIHEAKHGGRSHDDEHDHDDLSPEGAFAVGLAVGVVVTGLAIAGGIMYLGLARAYGLNFGGSVASRFPGTSSAANDPSGLHAPLLGGAAEQTNVQASSSSAPSAVATGADAA